MTVAASAPRKLVLLLADGLRDDTARSYMGYLQAMREAERAQWSTLNCELPSLSRPLYATLIIGRRPLDHGIVSNSQPGQAVAATLFDRLAEHGLRSAVAAYHWFFELLAGEVFQPLRHRHALPGRSVVGASWYFEDEYPDSHLLADAEYLRAAHQPDFLLVHPMGPDYAGHQHGGESSAYASSARKLDMLLAHAVPAWHAQGYDVLFTSDHGMHADRMHGGTLPEEREVPLVWLPCRAEEKTALPHRQLDVCSFMIERLSQGRPV